MTDDRARDELVEQAAVVMSKLFTKGLRSPIPESVIEQHRAYARALDEEGLLCVGDCAAYQELFELQWTRTREAEELWRAEDPEGRALVHPDLGELLGWLMERATPPQQDTETARVCAACRDSTTGPCSECAPNLGEPCGRCHRCTVSIPVPPDDDTVERMARASYEAYPKTRLNHAEERPEDIEWDELSATTRAIECDRAKAALRALGEVQQ